MNTEKDVKKLRKKVAELVPLLPDGDSLKFACIPFDERVDSEVLLYRIEKTNRKYPYNRCLFIACYESQSLKVDYKVCEQESLLTIKRDGKRTYRRVETDLGISPAEIKMLSIILYVKAFISQHKQVSNLKTNIAGEKRTQNSTISQLFAGGWFFLI